MNTTLLPEQKARIQLAIRRGLKTLERPKPLRLSEHAQKHFYLSPESSYVEGNWIAYPYQVGIMDCMSNDDIKTVVLRKSARVGYTKMLLACIAYMSHHKRRNQAVWQPVDDDAEEFAKTEVDTMIRDVPAMRHIFPWFDMKHKNNTLRQKTFIGSTLHIRGGKAGKNYRRISVDVAYLDEVDGFDHDVQGEGDPKTLSGKRLEGAVFPKHIIGSTPKLKATSLIEAYSEECEIDFRFNIPCPSAECGKFHTLTWGNMVFDKTDVTEVWHKCPHCNHAYTQSDYLQIWREGRWIDTTNRKYIDKAGLFRCTKTDDVVPAPYSIAFHVWTAYSPQTTWVIIAKDFLAARRDSTKMKTWVNLTLGESWEEKQESVNPNTVLSRREKYPTEVPQNALVLTAGVDTQDDRYEIYVMGWGEGEECWMVDANVIWGDPASSETQDLLDKALRASYEHESGARLGISAVCVDSGGHKTRAVYQFCYQKGARRIFAIKGKGGESTPLIGIRSQQNIGVGNRKVTLHTLGVDALRAVLLSNLQRQDPGPGYIHIPDNNSLFGPEFAAQITGYAKIKRKQRGKEIVEFAQTRDVIEASHCWQYGYAALHMLNPRLADLKHHLINAAKPKEAARPKPNPTAAKRQRQRGGNQWLNVEEDWI